jgi:2'-5' RNA ligase
MRRDRCHTVATARGLERHALAFCPVSERTVTVVIVAAFDAAADERVVRCMGRVGARTPPRHRPHLTLGAVAVPGGTVDDVTALAADVAARHAPFRLELASIGIFPQGVLWLGPRPDPALRAVQADVDATLAAAGHGRAFGDHADPARWVAHCTLVTRLRGEPLGRAVTALTRDYRPIGAEVAALATLLVGGRGDVGYLPLTGPRRAASGSG